MFHACDVKIAKIAAHSNPSSECGNSAMNAVTVIDRKPRTGTDCKMSSVGISTFSARRDRAAAVPYTNVNTTDRPSAMNIRDNERNAYPGSCTGSVDTRLAAWLDSKGTVIAWPRRNTPYKPTTTPATTSRSTRRKPGRSTTSGVGNVRRRGVGITPLTRRLGPGRA